MFTRKLNRNFENLIQVSERLKLFYFFLLWIVSEPLDVRNWFSSYEYESPVLNSNDNFGDSVSKESEFVKNELVIEESEGGREESHCGIGKRDEGLAGQKFCSNGSVKCSSFFGDHKLESQSFSKVLFIDMGLDFRECILVAKS